MNRRNTDKLVLMEKENNFQRDCLNQKNKQYFAANTNSALRRKIDQNLISIDQEKQSKKYDKYEKVDKEDYAKLREREVDSSFNDNSKFGDVSSTVNCKRENARKRGFQMKINNIDSINDKINNLLNMVKKDKFSQKIDQREKDKIGQRIYQGKNPSPSPSQKVQLNNKMRRQNGCISPIENKSNIKQNQHKVSLFDQISDFKGRSAQRNRPTSALDKIDDLQKPREVSNNGRFRHKYLPNDEEKDYSQSKTKKSYGRQESKYEYKQNWQERMRSKIDPNAKDTTSDKKYSQIKNSYDLQNTENKSKDIDKMLEERRKLREKQRQVQNSKFQNKYPVQQQSSFAGKWARQQIIESKFSPVQTPKTPKKYDRIFEQAKNIQTYLPVSLLKDNVPAQRSEKISSTTFLIDQQIKRIKSKIQQSQSNNNKLQQKLTEVREEDDSATSSNIAGKLYSKNRISPVKSLESKGRDEKQNMIKLATILSQQVEFDGRLRGVRQIFDKTANEEQWNQLHQKLNTLRYNLSLSQLKELIKISPDEHNPFKNDKNTSTSSSDLMQLFTQAQNNWENYVCKSVSLKMLRGQGFDVSDLDLSKKGCLGIQDLVCFINLNTGHFYRNRDIILIFRRLQIKDNQQNSSGIDYSTFLSTLTA